MKDHEVRKNLGELAAMGQQTIEAERGILSRAEELLLEVEGQIPAAKQKSLTGDGSEYLDLIRRRGELTQVIAKARAVLQNEAG